MTFPQFIRLPPELQLKIWAFSLPPPRVVDLFAVPVTESLQPRVDINTTSPESLPSRYSAEQTQEDAKDAPATVWTRTFVERIYTIPHSLSCLHTCAQARKIALKKYLRINADLKFQGEMQFVCINGHETMYWLGTLKGPRPFALLDPERDVLFLQDPPRTRDRTGTLVTSSLEILLRWLPVPIHALKRLAIPYYTWRKTRNNERLELLKEFENLEELYISFLGDNASGSCKATWSDLVGGLWSHFKEVEDEVKADIGNLKRKYPDWKAPMVRVVKHRGVLIEEI
jgi:hypothetical protein